MLPKCHLDLDLLRALVAIADTASFSQAATQLGRSQSAISLQIKRLEELVGRPLLERIQGRVTGPTDDGHVLLDYARQMLRLNDEAYSCFAAPLMTGTLRVGMPEELMESIFPAALKRFHEGHPRILLQLRSSMSSQLLAALEAGELDVTLFKHTEPVAPEGTLTLWHEPLVWVAAEGYRHCLPSSLPLALFGDGCAFRLAATTALARAGMSWHIAYCGASYTGMRHAVTAGLGVAVLPLSLVTTHMAQISKELPALPECHIAVKYAAGPAHPAAARLIEMVKEQIWRDRRPTPAPLTAIA